jgi:hypothetical protein
MSNFPCNFHDFLVKHAKFYFPEPDETKAVGSTGISSDEVGQLHPHWKAKYAVRDDTLVPKLCATLRDILGDMILPAGSEGLLAFFSPQLEVFEHPGKRSRVSQMWWENPHEARVSFPKDFFTAVGRAIRASADSTDRVGNC